MSRRALVLGAAGFIGAHLVHRLVADGWTVTGVLRDREAPYARARLGAALSEIAVVEGDACDPDLLGDLVAGTDVVFPLAGRSGAARSMLEPLADATANASGQLAALEAIRLRNPGARVVFPGSRLQYGRPKALPVGEDHPQEPTSVYGLHKMLGERYHLLYAERYGVATCCLRISNPYGPGQDRPDHAFGVVGTFLARAARDADITVFGDGSQQREYVFIDDLVDVLILAVTHPDAPGTVFNVGGPRPTSVREMADTVVRTVGRGRVVTAPWPITEAAVETGDYVGDLTRAWTVLGWRPHVDLDEGLALTWERDAAMLAGT